MSGPAPRVDVAVPTRGRERWCLEAVDSALGQAGVDVRVVVALDGPHPDLERELAARGSDRVLVVPSPTSGRSATRNAAVARATAPFVAFLDDDDVLLPGALAARVAVLARFPQAVLVCGPATALREGETRSRAAVELRACLAGARVRDGLAWQWKGNAPVPSTVLLRREVFDRVGAFDEDLETGEDWLFFLRAATVGAFVTLRAPTVAYRRHAGQVRGQPDAQERALPRWTARYFDDPRTPTAAHAHRARLEARHLAWIARNHRRVGNLPAERRCLRAAVRKDPRLLLHPRRLLRWLALATQTARSRARA